MNRKLIFPQGIPKGHENLLKQVTPQRMTLLCLIFCILLVLTSFVSAEKTWSFHNHSLGNFAETKEAKMNPEKIELDIFRREQQEKKFSLNVSNDIDLVGNITTTDTGFFKYLGSLANRNEVLKW